MTDADQLVAYMLLDDRDAFNALLRACPITVLTPQVDSGREVLDGASVGRDIV